MAKLKITLEIEDTDQTILKNDLLDINEWAQLMLSGKINNCWKRMQQQWTARLMNDESFTDAIPSNQADFVTLVTARDDYKTRAERDAASQIGE